MANSGAVQVKLELGHRAQVRKKPTVEGFTHDWIVFVRGPEQSNIQHFVEKVVFHLHESFPKPKRVFKDPPYKVEESGYAGFILPIEVYFRNKEEPKKVRFDYDLFLHLEGHPPVNHLRCEKLTFNNPTEEFRKKLLKAGGQRDPHKRSSEDSKVMVMQEGATSLFGQHMKLPTLPASTLASVPLSDAKKSKNFHGSKDGPKGSSTALLTASTTSTTSNNTPANHNNNNNTPPTNNNNNSSSFFKLHKASMEHKERPAKDLKEPKSALHRDSGWAPGHAPKEPSRKPKENQPLRDINPKIGFKEPKSLSSKERRSEGPCLGKRPPPRRRRRAPTTTQQVEKSYKKQARTPSQVPRRNSTRINSISLLARATNVSQGDGCACGLQTLVANLCLPQTYLDELVDLHRRLMTLREGQILQQIVNLIEETGHFHITNTTFDFDLCSLDRSTVRKLQSYLDASGLS
ncbi:LOW QUALITY PROTEIN: protein AF-9 [Gadus chalcogrammus]|uniref:LOW QUALITY PROTEIN: protein AF-9 n=1 Tax=Gadus chalcogrammus TaxID=1042646 RepID=UPI0024C4B37E|nr:LOW QUALITY PROTEIN: protein AF-9 [Gadus chalcogrammus]